MNPTNPTRGAPPSAADPPGFLAGGGDAGARLRAHDWLAHPLGDAGRWPAPLKTLVALLLDASQPMFVAWGPARSLLYNDGGAGLLGERHPAAFGAPFADAWGDAADTLGPILAAAADGIATHRDDVRFVVHRDGRRQEAHFALSYTPVRDDDGRIAGLLVQAHEVTARVRAEDELREHQRRLREQADRFEALADHIDQLAWMAGPDGAIDWYNRRWYAYTGTTFESMRGWGWQAVHHPDHVEPVSARFRRALADGVPWEDTFPLRARDGSYRWFLSRAHPIRDGDGHIVRWFGTNTDVTEQRRIESTLQEEARRKDEFLAMLSHELRNPLAPIRNGARLLRRAAPREPRVVQVADLIDRQVTHMSRLVDDLLDVSRLTRGLLAVTRVSIRLDDVIDDAIEQVGPLFDARRQAFTLVPSPEPVLVEADRVRLVQVLANLLDNAAKYTPPGGSVTLSVHADAAQVRLRVTDTGAGIAPAFLPRVFELFSQADRSIERGEGGLGLGLAVARALVELHGGTLEAESAGQGMGATFVVSLPRQRAAAPPA